MKTAFDEIKLQDHEKVKVWDVLLTPEGIKLPYQLQPILNKMSSQDIDDKMIPRDLWSFVGRIRILAVVDKKPGELKRIRFSISYCAPSDLFKYRRDRANAICVGRWNKAFGPEGDYEMDINHTGVIPLLESLKRETVVEAALAHVSGHLPQWIWMCTFADGGDLEKRINKEFINGR